MRFFINNPWTLVVLFILLVFVVFMSIKIIREYKLNSLLRQKLGIMRVQSREVAPRISRRLGMLTSAALTPIVTVFAIVIIGVNITKTPSGDLKSIQDSQAMLTLYEDLQGVYPKVLPSDLETPIEKSPEYDYASNTDDDLVIVEDLLYTANSRFISGSIEGSDSLTKLVYNDEFYYQAFTSSIEITMNTNNGVDVEGTQFVDSIVYVNGVGSCTQNYLIKGLHLTDTRLIVVGIEYPEQCIGIKLDNEYIFNNLNVFVSVIDLQDFTKSNTYRLSGNLSGVIFNEDSVQVITKKYIDYHQMNFNINEYIPYNILDGKVTTMDYSNIIYVEGTNPESFTTLFSIDIEKEEVSMETVLLDYYNDISITQNNINLTGYIYYLEPLSGLFNISNPIQQVKEITYRFNIVDNKIAYIDSIVK